MLRSYRLASDRIIDERSRRNVSTNAVSGLLAR
jgi:hypothetical protein